jgi:hypothetical protein
MSSRDWIWLGVIVLVLIWNYRLGRNLEVCRNRLLQHFLTWKLAAFGVTDWETKNELDRMYGVDCYSDAHREIVKAAAENRLIRLDLDHAKARIESEWRRW